MLCLWAASPVGGMQCPFHFYLWEKPLIFAASCSWESEKRREGTARWPFSGLYTPHRKGSITSSPTKTWTQMNRLDYIAKTQEIFNHFARAECLLWSPKKLRFILKFNNIYWKREDDGRNSTHTNRVSSSHLYIKLMYRELQVYKNNNKLFMHTRQW